ncbi:MAG: VWA domain-containing protein [Pseudomonadales bacterium]
MEILLTHFIAALRRADISVSPAETLDALRVLAVTGVQNRRLLRDALALTLAKTVDEKRRFEDCFELFFHDHAFTQRPESVFFAEVTREDLAGVIPPGHAPDSVELLFDRHSPNLAIALIEGTRASTAGALQSLRDKRHLVDDLLDWLEVPTIKQYLRESATTDQKVRSALEHLVHYLAAEVQAFVDRRYALRVDPVGNTPLIMAALESNLDQLPPAYYAETSHVIERLARALRQKYRERPRRGPRGSLDLPWMLRRNMRHDGVPFHLRFRERRHKQTTLYVICDVSGSVSRVARFLLLFLHQLGDALPHMRLFVFSSELAEITDRMATTDARESVEQALQDWGRGSTDYGQAFSQFARLVGSELHHRSSLLILGDARTNRREPGIQVLASLSQRLRQVLWLNPEPFDRWGEGDSLMHRYAPYCRRVDRCARLADLRHFAEHLLVATRR